MENPPEIGPVRKWKGSASSHYYAGIYYSQVLREVADDLYQIESAADPAEGYREMKQGLPRIDTVLVITFDTIDHGPNEMKEIAASLIYE